MVVWDNYLVCSKIVMPLESKQHLPDLAGETDSVVLTCYVGVRFAYV